MHVAQLAVNIGGAVIPSLMSLYLLIRYRLWFQGALATAGVAIVCHRLAQPFRVSGLRCRSSFLQRQRQSSHCCSHRSRECKRPVDGRVATIRASARQGNGTTSAIR
jgi:hypothetical protein